tara:strand:- start:447 stop:683 length:237 start_codon:yes stop_codon:yes gene_type:complete
MEEIEMTFNSNPFNNPFDNPFQVSWKKDSPLFQPLPVAEGNLHYWNLNRKQAESNLAHAVSKVAQFETEVQMLKESDV